MTREFRLPAPVLRFGCGIKLFISEELHKTCSVTYMLAVFRSMPRFGAGGNAVVVISFNIDADVQRALRYGYIVTLTLGL